MALPHWLILSATLMSCNGIDSNEDSLHAANDPLFGAKAIKVPGSNKLSKLEILDADLTKVKQFYVNSHRLKEPVITDMFDSALSAVERRVDEVRFVYSKENNTLHATVGALSKSFNISSLKTVSNLYEELIPVAQFLDENLSAKVDRAKVEYALINGALSSLDPHTILLPPVAAAEMEVDNKGEFGGLGIEITIKDGQLTVKQPIEGTPAAKMGIKADDKIVQIENTTTINMDLNEAVSLLRGKVGTSVTIYVLRKEWTDPKPIKITRAKIKIDPVKGELLSGNVGYISIQSFNANVSRDMNTILDGFVKGDNLKGLILDLRNNPGGYLRQAQLVADKFIDNGVIVSTVEGSKRKRNAYHAKRKGALTTIPMVVLVNASSASASEIVAGALRNLNRAIVIGERTFGKGSVQHLYDNSDESRLKLTVAQYLTPGDRSIQSVGIPPDIKLKPTQIRRSERTGEPIISLYWREWLNKEADLDKHLKHDSTLDDQTAFELRYLATKKNSGSETSINEDWEIGIAASILRNTPATDRASILLSAKDIIKKEQALQDKLISAAFKDYDIDWSNGTMPKNISLDAQFDFGEDKKLIAGQKETIKLKVTNNSDSSISQLSAYTKSNNPALDHREFYIGKLDAGETKFVSKPIIAPYGYISEESDIKIHFRTPDEDKIITIKDKVTTESNPLPLFQTSIKFYDDGSGSSKGNGDGKPQIGETIDLELSLTNFGDGNAMGPFARVKNKTRRALNLKAGSLELGTLLTKEQKACQKVSETCFRQIKPNETVTGRFSVELRESPDDIWEIELKMVDNKAYDYGSVVQGGFGDFYYQKQTIQLKKDVSFSDMYSNQPKLSIKRPPLNTKDDFIVFSGLATDDTGVQELMVFKEKDKIYYRGESGVRTEMPFAIEHTLKPGENRFYVLVRNNSGYTSSQAIAIYKQDNGEKK